MKNAAARLFDDENQTHIYVRAYEDGTKHFVVVAPDGEISDQIITKGRLITQFPRTATGKQWGMRVVWERGDATGQVPGRPGATPRASTILDSQRGEFQGGLSQKEGGEVKGKERRQMVEKGAGMKAGKPGAGGMSVEAVREVVATLTKGWKNLPGRVEVVVTAEEAVGSARLAANQEALRQGEDVDDLRDMKGFWSPERDLVVIVASNAESEAGVVDTAIHEIIKHYGVEGVLGSRADAFYLGLYEARPEVDRWARARGMMGNEPGMEGRGASTREKLRAAREWFAYNVRRGSLPERVWRKILDWLRQAIRRLTRWLSPEARGTARGTSDADLRALVEKAYRFVEKKAGDLRLEAGAGEKTAGTTEGTENTEGMTATRFRTSAMTRISRCRSTPPLLFHGRSHSPLGSILSTP